MVEFIQSNIQLYVFIVGIVLIMALLSVVLLQKREIAKNTHAEFLFRDADAKYHAVFNQSGVSVCISRKSDRILIEVNDTFLKRIGSDRKSVLGTRFVDWIEWCDPKLRAEYLKDSVLRGETRQVEAQLRSKDGRIRTYFMSSQSIVLENEPCLLSVAYDVTERIDAEQEKRRSELQLRQIIDLVPHMIFARDLEGKYLMANQAVADLYGKTVEEIVGSPMAEIHPVKEELEVFLGTDRKVIESGKRMIIPEHTFVSFEGVPQIVHTTKIPFEAPGTGEPAMLGVAVNVTEQKHAEAKFRDIVQLAPDAVISIDADHRIILFNQGAETIFGYEAAEIVGQPFQNLFPEDLREDHSAQIKAFGVASENSRSMNLQGKVLGLRKDETKFAAEASFGKLQQGGDAAFIILLRDVSERERWEDQLRHAQKMEAVGQLTSGIAHDFNNLLTIILGNLEILQRRIDDGAQTDLLFTSAIAAAQRGGDLTQHLLAFSRKSALDPKPTDLVVLVDDIVKLITRTIGKNIIVRFSASDDLWQVDVDRALLQSALMNLAINAGHAMPTGGNLHIKASNIPIKPLKVILLGELKHGDYVKISVIDDGIGMSPKTVKRAFDPYFTTKDIGEGTGLGLSMVHGFAQQSGGQVRILSKMGSGTTVELFLPRTSEENVSDEDNEDRVTANAEGTETVLLVEDDHDVRQIAVSHLARWGYNVIEAYDGRDALNKLQNHTDIDILFTDVMLPGGISGIDLASSALQLQPDIKLLFSSGNEKLDVAHDFGAEGEYVFLPKPYLRNDLAAALQNLLR